MGKPASASLIDEKGGYSVEVEEGYLVTTDDGHKLYVRIYKPAGNGPYAAVVFVPGGLGAGVMGPASLEAREIGVAEYGVVEVYFNAPGRGPPPYTSEGEGDCNGYVDQDALRCVVEYVKSLDYVDPENVGILSFSYGVTMAAGCVGRYPDLVKFYIDAEGPSHSVLACCDYLGAEHRADTHDNLFNHYSAGYDPSPENVEWWKQREAFRYIESFHGAYLRLQGERGHMQPEVSDDYPAKLMNNVAVLGKPWWVRINFDNPVNKLYGVHEPIPHLLGPGKVKDWKPIFRKAVIEMAKLTPGQPEETKPAKGEALTTIDHYPYNQSLPYPSPCALQVPDISVDEEGGVYYVAKVGDTGECWAARASKRERIIQLNWAYPYLRGAYSIGYADNRVIVADCSGVKLLTKGGRLVWEDHSLTNLVGVDLLSADVLLIAEEGKVYAKKTTGEVLWQIAGLEGVRSVKAVGADKALVCLSDRVVLFDRSGATILEYCVDNPLDADYEGGKLYVATGSSVVVVEGGSVVATYSTSASRVEVLGNTIFVVEGTTIKSIAGAPWVFEC